ncbi:hypothetical protein SKC42_22175 [Mycobacterium sp. 050134]
MAPGTTTMGETTQVPAGLGAMAAKEALRARPAMRRSIGVPTARQALVAPAAPAGRAAARPPQAGMPARVARADEEGKAGQASQTHVASEHRVDWGEPAALAGPVVRARPHLPALAAAAVTAVMAVPAVTA